MANPMSTPSPRDLIGYGGDPPHPHWPGEARIAVNFVINYWVRVDDRAHLVVPYSLTANDTKFGSGGLFTADDSFTFVKDGFDVLYREGKTQPKMMSLGLHLRLIGHPSRAAGLERVLDYVKGHEAVWITRRIDIAQHWRKTHPPATANVPLS